MLAVADPDLEIRGGGGGGGGLQIFFSALRASVWSKNKGLAWETYIFDTEAVT